MISFDGDPGAGWRGPGSAGGLAVELDVATYATLQMDDAPDVCGCPENDTRAMVDAGSR
jgi:hypothetical protein